MAKVQLTESQLTNVIEQATREALQKITEGAGWDTFKGAFKDGMDSASEPLPSKDYMRDVIKNGNGANYDEWIRNKRSYEKSKNVDQRAANRLERAQRRVKNGANPEDADIDLPNKIDHKMNTAIDRRSDAYDTVMAHPGLGGKFRRAAAAGSTLAGYGLGKVKQGATDFVHNKLGIETEE